MAPPKKAAKPASEPAHDFKSGDVVLCKVKGYPEWPGKLVEHDTASSEVLKQKGNKAYLVRFFPDGDYHWAIPKEMKYLSPKSIEAYLADTSKKNGKLRQSYEIAKDPAAWEESIKNQPPPADDGDEEEEEDVDMLAEDGEAKSSKKRKRPAEGAASKKEKKEPKEKKEAASKKRKTEEKKEKPSSKATKPAKVSASVPEGASEGEKTTRGWRATLQKAFLTDKGLPPAEKMPEFDQIFSSMEKFDMQPEWLTVSKLGKVLKKMSALPEIPRDDEFKIKERSNALIEKWKEMLAKEGEEPASATAGDVTMTEADKKPEPNGTAAAAAEPAVQEEEKKPEGDSSTAATEGAAPAPQANGEKKDETPAADAGPAPAPATTSAAPPQANGSTESAPAPTAA